MKRLVVAMFAAAALAVVAAPVVNAAPAEKTTVCHVNSANDTVDLGFLGTYVFGKMVLVSDSALPAHFDHGDGGRFVSLDHWIGQLAIKILEKLGLALPNADCLFRT